VRKGDSFGQNIWDKNMVLLGTYWETTWELDQNTLGIRKTKKLPHPIEKQIGLSFVYVEPCHLLNEFFISKFVCDHFLHGLIPLNVKDSKI
jgi:hypothetical protein